MSDVGMGYVLSVRGVVKMIEAVLIVITMGLWYGLSVGWANFVTGTIMTAVYATVALGAQNLIMGPSRVAELLLYGLCALFLVICSIIIFVKVTSSLGTATGVFCLLTGVVYGGDLFVTIKFTDDPTS